MAGRYIVAGTFVVALLAGSVVGFGQSSIAPLLRCQRTMARAGARFANKTIRGTLKCTNAIVKCQVNCDEGVFGPSCQNNPPPCCDSGDPNSNEAFGDCMDDANARCVREQNKIADAEQRKRDSITKACSVLTNDELCGASTPGLNFAVLNAGCAALDPNFQCDLPSLLDCVGGPLEKALAEQVSALLDPRATEGIAVAGVEGLLPGIPIARKVSGTLAAGTVDIWSIDGTADEEIIVRVKTRNDNGDGTSNLDPVVTYIGLDGTTPLANTNVVNGRCSVPNVCGKQCPAIKRRFPFTGTFFLAIEASQAAGCTGGSYQLIVITPEGTMPVLVSAGGPAAGG